MIRDETEKPGIQTRYLVIKGNEIQRDVSLAELIKTVSGIESNSLVMGYDAHLGFKIPDNANLRELLKGLGKTISVETRFIDERKQSGRHFSPTQVYVEINGRPTRKTVANSSSTYVSQQPLNLGKIIEAYKELGFEKEIKSLLEKMMERELKNLGEFLSSIHHLLLNQQLSGLKNVSVSSPKFDKYNPETKSTGHEVTTHNKHHLLWIGLHGLRERSLEYLIEKFEGARKTGLIGKNPRYIIIPQNPTTHFRRTLADAK